MELRWADRATIDLDEIADHYAQLGPDIPDTMLECLYEAPLILLERPRLGAPIGSYELRKWLVRDTPFLLLYRIQGDIVEVARVLHGASNWKSVI